MLFQSLPHNPLVDVIEGCTHSNFSHCGIAHRAKSGWTVIEAIGPVKETPLKEWVTQARDGKVSVYRLKPAYQPFVTRFVAATRTYYGRPYDASYEFDDEKIYCSELLFKAFRAATGESLGTVQRLGELDWKPYRKIIEQIEGGPVPVQRAMITPQKITEAPQVERVKGNLSLGAIFCGD